MRRAAPAAGRSVFTILPPEKADLGDWIALSPDGRSVAFPASVDGATTIWVRSLDSSSPRSVPGTEGATFPFWSPDGRSLGFFDGEKLKRIDLAGGPATVLCDAPSGPWRLVEPRGDDHLFRSGVHRNIPDSGSRRIAEAGDDRRQVGRRDHAPLARVSAGRPALHLLRVRRHARPDRNLPRRAGFHPEGSRSRGRPPCHRGARTSLLRARGHPVARSSIRLAQPIGDAVPIAERVWFTNEYFGHSSISASPNGTVAFRDGKPEKQHLVRPDRKDAGRGRLGPSLG